MKALSRRLERLERATQPEIDAFGVTLRERLERGRQRLREAGHVGSPAPQWVVDRLRSTLSVGASRERGFYKGRL